MKLYITVEQLNELTDKGKKKLILWVTKLTIPNYSSFEGIMISNPDLKDKALLSIGQMIQFLGKDYKYTVITRFGDQERDITEVVEPDKLCDCLWEAVKEILK